MGMDWISINHGEWWCLHMCAAALHRCQTWSGLTRKTLSSMPETPTSHGRQRVMIFRLALQLPAVSPGNDRPNQWGRAVS